MELGAVQAAMFPGPWAHSGGWAPQAKGRLRSHKTGCGLVKRGKQFSVCGCQFQGCGRDGPGLGKRRAGPPDPFLEPVKASPLVQMYNQRPRTGVYRRRSKTRRSLIEESRDEQTPQRPTENTNRRKGSMGDPRIGLILLGLKSMMLEVCLCFPRSIKGEGRSWRGQYLHFHCLG